VANWLFAQTTHVAVSKSKFACRVASGVVLYFKFYKNRSSGFGAVGGRKSPFPVTLAIGLYNSLYYRTSREKVINLKKNFRQSIANGNGKPLANAYSHNCTMYTATMLKFGRLFDIVKYLEHIHIKVSAYGVRQGASSPTLKSGNPLYLGNW